MGQLRTRLARPADAAAIAAIYAPYVTDSVISFEAMPPDPATIGERMAAGGELYPWLVASDVDGGLAGYAYASNFRGRHAYRFTVETTVYVDRDRHRGGIGRALYAALLDLLTAQGFTRAMAGITLPNAGSVGLHEHLGFAHVGRFARVGWKFGTWHDVGMWQRPLAPEGTPPAEPRPFRAIWRDQRR